MRILHTADWHLGRTFHNVRLTEDQAYVLEQLVKIVADRKPDVVVVAGDVYDRSLPSPEAVTLLSETLTRIVKQQCVKTIVIAGNHDGPERMEFAASLLVCST